MSKLREVLIVGTENLNAPQEASYSGNSLWQQCVRMSTVCRSRRHLSFFGATKTSPNFEGWKWEAGWLLLCTIVARDRDNPGLHSASLLVQRPEGPAPRPSPEAPNAKKTTHPPPSWRRPPRPPTLPAPANRVRRGGLRGGWRRGRSLRYPGVAIKMACLSLSRSSILYLLFAFCVCKRKRASLFVVQSARFIRIHSGSGGVCVNFLCCCG